MCGKKVRKAINNCILSCYSTGGFFFSGFFSLPLCSSQSHTFFHVFSRSICSHSCGSNDGTLHHRGHKDRLGGNLPAAIDLFVWRKKLVFGNFDIMMIMIIHWKSIESGKNGKNDDFYSGKNGKNDDNPLELLCNKKHIALDLKYLGSLTIFGHTHILTGNNWDSGCPDFR